MTSSVKSVPTKCLNTIRDQARLLVIQNIIGLSFHLNIWTHHVNREPSYMLPSYIIEKVLYIIMLRPYIRCSTLALPKPQLLRYVSR